MQTEDEKWPAIQRDEGVEGRVSKFLEGRDFIYASFLEKNFSASTLFLMISINTCNSDAVHMIVIPILQVKRLKEVS